MPYTLLEKVENSADKLRIPYTKYRLHNGLTVILHQDQHNPLVHVEMTYHVGSGREEVGKSGFAHFFEHMMFEGSKHVANNEHFRLISEAGGTLNGTTNRDRTNYFETLPKNQLALALWLESDRMGYLLEAMTEESFQNQLSVIKNEKAQRYENQPYGMLSEVTQQNLYPDGHPYSWTTIGYTEDLDRVSLKDMMAFFKKWYGPNNATLSIGGDIDIEKTLELVEHYFGTIPGGEVISKPTYQSFELSETRYVSYKDQVRFPLLEITWPTVRVYHEDEAALDVLSDVLGDGKTSILYQRFVKTQKAVQVFCQHICYEGAGEMRLGILAYPQQNLRDIEQEVEMILQEISANGLPEDEIARISTKYYAQALYGIEKVPNKVGKISNYQLFAPSANYLAEDVERYKHVTPEKVAAVFKAFIEHKPSLRVSFYDEAHQNLLPAKDNYQYKRSGLDKVVLATDVLDSLHIERDINRNEKPQPGPVPTVTVPHVFHRLSDNGLQLWAVENHSSPTVALQLVFPAGSMFDPAGKSGTAALLANMLRESTHNYSAEAFSDALDRLGASIQVQSGKEKIRISVHALSEHLAPTMSLLEEMLFHPAFKEDEFDRNLLEQKELLHFQDSQTDVLANRGFYKAIYGHHHPLGRPASGTLTQMDNIAIDDVKHHYLRYIIPNHAICALSGDVQTQDLEQLLGFLQKWSPGEPIALSTPKALFPGKGKVVLVHKEGAAQSEFRIGYPALAYDAHGTFFKANIMNFSLGMAFNSRININLREDKGYTYGARSYFSGGKYQGPYIAAAAVGKDTTADAVRECIKELDQYRNEGITEAELAFTKQSLLNIEAIKYDSNVKKTGFLLKMAEFGLDKNFVERQKEILANIAVAEVNQLAKDWLPVEEMVTVIAGNVPEIRDAIEALGIGDIIVEESPKQTTLNT